MATNKGIPVINNFDLYAQKPLDSRVVIENEQELGELVNKGAIYDGMIFYRKDAQKFFQAQYLESGLTFTEFGGATSLDDCLFLVANASQQVVLTQEQYNNIVNKKYNFIFLSLDGILLLPTYINATTEKVDIYFSVANNDTTKMIITTLMFFWTPTQLASGMSPYPASLDIRTEELSYFYYDDNGEPKEIKFVGLPSIDNLDVAKPFVPQAKGGVVNWVEQTTDTAIITLSDSQIQSLGNLQITFTQEQAALLEKSTSFKFIYNALEIGHGQCGKIMQDNVTLYGLTMTLGVTTYTGTNGLDTGTLSSYSELITLKQALLPIDYVNKINVDGSNLYVLYVNQGLDDNYFIYLDTINGQPIVHKSLTEVKDHTIPTITFVD